MYKIKNQKSPDASGSRSLTKIKYKNREKTQTKNIKI